MIAQELSISFWDSTGPDIIIHQGEKGREIEFIPDIALPNGAAAQIVIVKPDKTFTISDCTINNHDHIIAEIPEQAGAVIGLAHYIIKITDTDTRVYSASGGLWVDDALLTDAMIESVAEVNGYVFPDDFLTAADLADYVTDSELTTALQPYALAADVPVIAANPSGAATGTLEKLQINNDIFAMPRDVVANPTGTATEDLNKLQVGETIYGMPNPLEVYSSTKTQCGVWTDGRPIYRQYFYTGDIYYRNYASVSTGVYLPNVDFYVRMTMLMSDGGCYDYLMAQKGSNGYLYANNTTAGGYSANAVIVEFVEVAA